MAKNLLHKEQSPYLLQHANNPVHWHPWNEEAFDLAKKLNKPVFLSIGYATCHWCHVMAHESFEDETVADLMNDAFVNIKVDREERPDIDHTYMTVCQMLTGHGGWPLTIIMTPDKEPFFAATYIPKENRFERVGMLQLIPAIKHHWINEYESIQKAINSISSGYVKQKVYNPVENFDSGLIEQTIKQMSLRFDPEFGGFGTAPKFPTPHNLLFLMRHAQSNKDIETLEMVVKTLTKMRLGGIFDQVGYGFHRYSTDREWLLPHFEKMLYDQALLILAYSEAYQITKNPLFKQTVSEIVIYLKRDLLSPLGGFYSAEDADSEGEEGKFYTWSSNELRSILNEEEYTYASEALNMRDEGNFNDESTRKPTGLNIPHYTNKDFLDSEMDVQIRSKLFEHRSTRVRPQLDDKILTDWNALLISALAKAGFIFNNNEYTNLAIQGIHFIEKNLVVNDKLKHRYRNGDADIDAFADDYAFLIWAYIELYQATFDSAYLSKAISWNNEFTNQFWDNSIGGFFFTKDEKDQPFGREKIVYDGAIPSANSVSMLNLLKLSKITANPSYASKANSILKLFGEQYQKYGEQHTQALQAIQFEKNRPSEIVIAEGKSGIEVSTFLKTIKEYYLPNSVILVRPRNEMDPIFELSNFIKKQQPLDDETTVYLCENFVCKKPVTNVSELRSLITQNESLN